MKPSRLTLRNRILRQLQAWPQLGCVAHELHRAPKYTGRENSGNRRDLSFFLWRLIGGVAKDGRAILLYPVLDRAEVVPGVVSSFMIEYESRGALVGCVTDISDAWDVVFGNESEYKRKARTYSFRYWHYKRNAKQQKGGEEE